MRLWKKVADGWQKVPGAFFQMHKYLGFGGYGHGPTAAEAPVAYS